MLKSGNIKTAFNTYWDNMNLCHNAKAYWALLHVTVCLPDICAALESNDGKTSKKKYIDWCNKYFSYPKLDGPELYGIRCMVLHQGRASAVNSSRYTGYSFAEPAPNGTNYHKVLDGTTLILDVYQLSQEVRESIKKWIDWLESNTTDQKAKNTLSNLSSLVKTRTFPMTTPSGYIQNISRSS